MGDDFVVHGGRFQKNAENFARGPGRGRERDMNLSVADVFPDLSLNLFEAAFEGAHRVAVRPSVEGCGDLAGFKVDEAGFRGGGAAVHAEDIFASGDDFSFLRRQVGDSALSAFQAFEPFEQNGAFFEQLFRGRKRAACGSGHQGRAVCLEPGRLFGDDKFDLRHALPNEAQNIRVLGDAARQQNFPFFNPGPLQKIGDLDGHNVGEGKNNIPRSGFALVQAVRAVAFHEDRTARGKLQDAAVVRNAVDVVERHVHPGQLLLEEFAGARSAFVAGKAGNDFVL
ncbi:MAG: hypothetical protein BWX45_00729 [Deltaproteobacteria bacterium ADurb.Bin002]|nr:MAG: hypothetical protein BWX45_00729 [Deltaproteobacteria bacterium ADurb.Bin002]